MDKRVPPSSSLEQFWSRRNGRKSARELRQGGSNYRCCIPALAGFVSPQSKAPDGEGSSAQDRHRAIEFYDSAVKPLALLLVIALQVGCTTQIGRAHV